MSIETRTNKDRAALGKTAINAYWNNNPDAFGPPYSLPEEIFVDCISDILHLTKLKGHDIAAISRMALMHVESETEEHE